MTQAQRIELDRAVARAAAEAIRLVAHGARARDGAPIYLVTSASQPGHNHVVAVYRGRLTRACPVGQEARICKHRSRVYLYLAREAWTTDLAAHLVMSAGHGPVITPPNNPLNGWPPTWRRGSVVCTSLGG